MKKLGHPFRSRVQVKNMNFRQGFSYAINLPRYLFSDKLLITVK